MESGKKGLKDTEFKDRTYLPNPQLQVIFVKLLKSRPFKGLVDEML